MLQFDTRTMLERRGRAAKAAPPRRRARCRRPRRRSSPQPIPHGLFADRARRHRADDRVRAGDAGRRSRSTPPMWCRSTASSGTTSLAIVAIAVLAMLAFQAADIYQVQAFRGYEKQYFRLASAWSVVFLIVIGISFFAKAGDQFSRVWLGSFYVVGLIVLIAFRRGAVPAGAALDPARAASTAAPSIVGGDEKGAALINALDGAARLRRPHHRRVRRPRRRPLAARRSSGLPKLGIVDDLVEFARRTRVDLVIFSLPISAEGAHPADAQEALGAAGRHPPRRRIPTSCASARAPIPISATSRCSTCSTSRSPTGTS